MLIKSSISKAKWLHYSGALNLYASEVHISELHKPPQPNREFEIEFFQHCLAQVHQVLRTRFCHDNFLVQAFNEVAQCFQMGNPKVFILWKILLHFPLELWYKTIFSKQMYSFTKVINYPQPTPAITTDMNT